MSTNELWSTNVRTPLANSSLDHRFWVTFTRIPAATLVIRSDLEVQKQHQRTAATDVAEMNGAHQEQGCCRHARAHVTARTNFTGCFKALLNITTATVDAAVGPRVRVRTPPRTIPSCSLAVTATVAAGSQHMAGDAVLATVTSNRTGLITIMLRTSRAWPLYLPATVGSDTATGELWLSKTAINTTANALTVAPCDSSTMFPSVQHFAAPGNGSLLSVRAKRQRAAPCVT
jgi:hypothetical protein